MQTRQLRLELGSLLRQLRSLQFQFRLALGGILPLGFELRGRGGQGLLRCLTLGGKLLPQLIALLLELGVAIINDPSGLTWDPELARTVSNANAGLIVNHMRGTPDQWAKLPPLKNPALVIAQELEAAVHRATLTGLDRKRIVIDPGLGFGKRKEQNADILAHLGALARLELPLMVGASRKHFLAKESADQTEFATAAAS